MLIIPFIAKKAGVSILIPGKLKKPAKIATIPITNVVKWAKLFGFIPFFNVFICLRSVSNINPIPIINIHKASIWYVILRLNNVSVTIPKKPRMLTMDSIVINFDETFGLPILLFY